MTGPADRMACVVKGYKIRAAIDQILQVTDQGERREFDEGVVRPETLHDVSFAVESLRGEVNTLSECGYDAAVAQELAGLVARAGGTNDTAAMSRTITRVWDTIKARGVGGVAPVRGVVRYAFVDAERMWDGLGLEQRRRLLMGIGVDPSEYDGLGTRPYGTLSGDVTDVLDAKAARGERFA